MIRIKPLIILTIILLLINIGWVLDIPYKFSTFSNSVTFLSQNHSFEFVPYALSTFIALTTLAAVIVSIVFTLKSIPYYYAFKYFVNTKRAEWLVVITIFLIFYSFLLITVSTLPLINAIFYYSIFSLHVILVFHISFVTFKSTQPEELLSKLLPNQLLNKLKKIEITPKDPLDSNLKVIHNRFEFINDDKPYKVHFNSKTEGVIAEINFRKLSEILQNNGVNHSEVVIYSHIRPGDYLPNVYDFSYIPNLESFNVFIIGTDSKETFDNLLSIPPKLSDNLNGAIVFSDNNDAIIEFNQHISDIFNLLKHQNENYRRTINWLKPIENYFVTKRKVNEEISNIEGILIFRLLNHFVYDRAISIDTHMARNIVTIIYTLSGLLRSKENISLGRIVLDLLDRVSFIMIQEGKNRTTGMAYSIVLRYSENVSISVLGNQAEDVNSDYFKLMAKEGINRVTIVLANSVANRGLYSDSYLDRLFSYNLQSLISFLVNYRHLQPIWFNDVANHLARRILYFVSILFISDLKYSRDNISSYSFFVRYGVDLIKYSNSSLFHATFTDILNEVISDHEFTEPSDPHISDFFENTLHQAGGYTPHYFDFKQVWLCFLVVEDIPITPDFNADFQTEIKKYAKGLDTRSKIEFARICNISLDEFNDRLTSIIKDNGA